MPLTLRSAIDAYRNERRYRLVFLSKYDALPKSDPVHCLSPRRPIAAPVIRMLTTDPSLHLVMSAPRPSRMRSIPHLATTDIDALRAHPTFPLLVRFLFDLCRTGCTNRPVG